MVDEWYLRTRWRTSTVGYYWVPVSSFQSFFGVNMSQMADLQAIRNGVTITSLPENVQTTVLLHLDKLPNLYEKLAKTCESRFLDEILRHVQGMLKTIHVPSSIETVTDSFQAMHERHGIPTLGLKRPVAIAVKQSRSKKVISAFAAPVPPPSTRKTF